MSVIQNGNNSAGAGNVGIPSNIVGAGRKGASQIVPGVNRIAEKTIGSSGFATLVNSRMGPPQTAQLRGKAMQPTSGRPPNSSQNQPRRNGGQVIKKRGGFSEAGKMNHLSSSFVNPYHTYSVSGGSRSALGLLPRDTGYRYNGGEGKRRERKGFLSGSRTDGVVQHARGMVRRKHR